MRVPALKHTTVMSAPAAALLTMKSPVVKLARQVEHDRAASRSERQNATSIARTDDSDAGEFNRVMHSKAVDRLAGGQTCHIAADEPRGAGIDRDCLKATDGVPQTGDRFRRQCWRSVRGRCCKRRSRRPRREDSSVAEDKARRAIAEIHCIGGDLSEGIGAAGDEAVIGQRSTVAEVNADAAYPLKRPGPIDG